MSHTGNWPRNPRKMALEIARQVAEGGPQPTKIVTLYAISRGEDVYALHPCRTVAQRWRVSATCYGCQRVSDIPLEPLVASGWAHAPWPRIMPTLACSDCGERPEELAVWSAGISGAGRYTVGKLTVRKPTQEELAALSPRRGAVWRTQTFTPEELVWRRPGASEGGPYK